MSSRGVHFALSVEDDSRVRELKNNRDLGDIVEALEARWDGAWLQETDKAWDAIHRCLTNGRLSFRPSNTLAKCILGGMSLQRGERIVSYLSADEVKEVASEITVIGKEWMRQRYYAIPAGDYGMPLTEVDFEYTWSWFESVKAFFNKASSDGRSVLFVVCQ
jgi:hypothetical protein